jgi:hypothetical protein
LRNTGWLDRSTWSIIDDRFVSLCSSLAITTMPKLYEYFGLIVLFYSNEHEPIHVHGKYQETESKAEIIFEDGKFVEVRISEVIGKRPLDRQRLAMFKQIVERYRDDIVNKWIDFFVYNKSVHPETITKKI